MSSKLKIILTIFSTAILLFFLLVAFYLGKKSSNKENKALLKSYYDLSYLGNIIKLENENKAEISKALNNTGINLDSILYDIPKVPTPFVGVAPKPGKYSSATINKQQFRRNKEILIPKPKNLIRIFITGGSVAFGSGAKSNQVTIDAYLEKILNNSLSLKLGKQFEVINASCPAWTSTHERIWIENKLSEMQPDIIISFSGHNDVHFNLDHQHNTLFYRTYWENMHNLIIKNTYSSAKYPVYEEVVNKLQKPDVELSKNILTKNIHLVNSINKDFKYVYILQPTLITSNKQKNDFEMAVLSKRSKEAILNFKKYYSFYDDTLSKLKNSNFNYYNFNDVFNSITKEEYVFFDACHLNESGNKIIAFEIYKKLQEDSILSQ